MDESDDYLEMNVVAFMDVDDKIGFENKPLGDDKDNSNITFKDKV